MFNYNKYNDTQLDYFDELTLYRRLHQPRINLTAKEWLTLYPELKDMFTSLLVSKKEELKQLSKEILQEIEEAKTFDNTRKILRIVALSQTKVVKRELLKKNIKWFELGFIEYDTNNTIPQEIINQAREYPVKDLMSIEGRRGTYPCPFHDDSTPSFHIFSNNSWHCFGCQKHGNNAIDFIMAKDGLSFTDAVKYLTK